jgi:hypothetical protein
VGKEIRIFKAAETFSELEIIGLLLQAFTAPFQELGYNT